MTLVLRLTEVDATHAESRKRNVKEGRRAGGVSVSTDLVTSRRTQSPGKPLLWRHDEHLTLPPSIAINVYKTLSESCAISSETLLWTMRMSND